MAKPIVRAATLSDTDAIVAMLRQIYAQHLAWDAARWTTSQPPHVTYGEWIAELIERPIDGCVRVAEVGDALGGAIGGYLLAEVEAESTRHWTPRALYVHDLFVAPAHRRVGIARALMNALFEWSAAAAHPDLQVRLMTAAPNEPARAFFATFGFKPCVIEMIRDRPLGK